ncbi:exported hypothetical protein [Paraburkholderia tropica]|uniref:hypothetical protein n=1 Tax=Paraburkholderia tropica TaxID=92647 RepID=UPI001CB5B200|nr:hypothetical protein [Paraburkholderia tropica]CAG9195996.1 exported hypothetical protein [Paraburkholderia tropica]
MKRSLMLLAAGIAALAIAGCATVSSADKLAKQVCTPVQQTVTSLQSLQGFNDNAAEKLDKAADIVNTTCDAVSAVDVSSLEKFSSTAFPALIDVVNATSWTDEKKQQIGLTLTAAQLVLNSIISSMPTQTETAVATTDAASAVSAAAVASDAVATQ